jgi:hypothetical protein
MNKTYIIYKHSWSELSATTDMVTLTDKTLIAIMIGYEAEFTGDHGIWDVDIKDKNILQVGDIISTDEGKFVKIEEIRYIQPLAPAAEPSEAIYQKALTIYNDQKLDWKTKYDLIFSDEISAKAPKFDWYSDNGYDDDVIAYMNAFTSYMKNSGHE